MARRMKALLTVVIALPVAYTAAAWLIGMNVQAQLENREQEALSSAPYVALTHHAYQRGVWSATEESTYALRIPGLLARATAAVPGGASSLQLTVRNRIYHGPLPRFRSIALALIDTELVPPPQVGKALSAVFGGQSVVSIHTTMGWLGETHTELSSPAFKVQLPAGAVLSSRGLQASVETTRGRSSFKVHLTSGGFGIEGPQGRGELGQIGLDAALQRAFEVLYVGDARLRVAGAQFQGPSAAALLLKGLSVRSASSVSGQYVDTGADLAADELDTQKLSFSRLVYSLHLMHLEGTSLAGLTQAVRQAQAAAVAGGTPPAPAAMRDAFSHYGVDLLVHDPVFEIPQLGFAMPEGQFQLSATLAAHGIKREDLSGPGGIMAAIPHLDAAVDARIDVALLEKLIGLSAQAAQHSDQIQKLAQQGLLKREGSAWRVQLAYHAGKLTVNGQPYPPAPSPPS